MIDKIAWMLIEDGKVLFLRSKGQNLFYTVGGKREPGESDEETLVREAREEIGVEPISDTIGFGRTFFGTADHEKDKGLRIRCYFAQHTGTPHPSSEIAEVAWFSTQDAHRTTPLGGEILAWLHAEDLID